MPESEKKNLSISLIFSNIQVQKTNYFPLQVTAKNITFLD